MNVVSCDLDDEDPFLAADESMALQELIDETMTGCDHCECTVNGEDDVTVCLDACSDTWKEEFFDNRAQEDQGKEQDEEAILSLEDIQLFLVSGEFYGQFVCCADSHCKQTTLHDFI